MNEIELIDRTKQFALRVLKLVEALPKTMAGNTVRGIDNPICHKRRR